MIPEQPKNLDRKHLVQNTGIQFLDLDLVLSAPVRARHDNGYFSRDLHLITRKNQRNLGDDAPWGAAGTPEWDLESDYYDETLCCPATAERETAAHRLLLEDTLQIFAGKWLPMPFFLKLDDARGYQALPRLWCRGYLTPLDLEAGRYRLVLAFDTRTIPQSDRDNARLKDLFLSEQFVVSSARYELCRSLSMIMSFAEKEPVVDNWILELWKDHAARQGLGARIRQNILTDKLYRAHYYQLLFLLTDPLAVKVPELSVTAFGEADPANPPVRVNLALDIGNSRICGLMYETHGDDTEGIKNRYRVQIRDFTHPEQVYDEPFPSCVEFAYPSFDRYVSDLQDNCFQWCSMVRVGEEAQRLSWNLEGSEGTSGMSSPKRYLWDTDDYAPGWKVNPTSAWGHEEDRALIQPCSNHVTSSGELIEPGSCDLSQAVYTNYSRSSVMALLVNEVIAQVACQINSIGERSCHADEKCPRILGHLVFTVPTAMPPQEVEIFRRRVDQGIKLYWIAMGWLRAEENEEGDLEICPDVWPPLPEVTIKYDEAICSQIVYLYNELQFRFAGHFNYFREIMSRYQGSRISVATVDFGGGTTDFVINDFVTEDAAIDSFRPEQRFTESFRIAGDDLLLELVREFVLPSISTYCCRELGLPEGAVNDLLLDRLGVHSRDKTIQAQTFKKHLTLQLFYPLALALIRAYQDYGTDAFQDPSGRTFAEILRPPFSAECHEVTPQVLAYINSGFRNLSGKDSFDVMQVPLQADFVSIHTAFVTCNRYDLCCRVIRYITEIINRSRCDVVLLSGRLSKLPGILSAFRNRLMIAPERIVRLSDLTMGAWYPYAVSGRIEDPKTAVAMGALMLLSCNLGKVENFYIKLGDNVKLKSSVHYIGKLDSGGSTIAEGDVYYREVDLDSPSYVFREKFRIPGRITLGYRSMPVERWPASPLYKIILSDELARNINEVSNGYLELTLARKENDDARGQGDRYLRDSLVLQGTARAGSRELEVSSDPEDPGRNVFLKLCTMPFRADGAAVYWLDSGCVKDE